MLRKKISTLVIYFMMMEHSSRRDNKNEVISVDSCFSFSPLSFLICISSSSLVTGNTADSNTLNASGSLPQYREETSSVRKYFSVFLLSSDKLCKIQRTKFLSSLQFIVISIISTFFFLS